MNKLRDFVWSGALKLWHFLERKTWLTSGCRGNYSIKSQHLPSASNHSIFLTNSWIWIK